MTDDKPKLIYKYTHAQAVADGELRLIPWKGPVPLYISKDADKLFEKVDDDIVATAVAYALVMAGALKPWPQRMKCQHEGIDYEIVFGRAIRDDEKAEYICTIVAPGER